MTLVARFALLLTVSAVLAGCGSTARSLLESDDGGVQPTASPNLALPPDLRLPPPGSAPPAPPPSTVASYDPPAAAAPADPSAPRPQFGDDVYAQAGISVNKPDGTRKSDQELREELRRYYIAKKQQKNPNYGTVFNMGNIFRDE